MAFLGHELAKVTSWLRTDFGKLLTSIAVPEKTSVSPIDPGDLRKEALLIVEESIDSCDDMVRLRVLAKQLARDLVMGEPATPKPTRNGEPSCP